MTNTTENTATSNKPSHYAYHVRKTGDGKMFKTRIGSAWQQSDGKGFNLILDCLPIDGRISLRTVTENQD